jgi:hypothetical protein
MAQIFKAIKVPVFDQNGVELITDPQTGQEIKLTYKDYALQVLKFPAKEIDTLHLADLVQVIRKIKNLEPDQEVELLHEEMSTLKTAVAEAKVVVVSEEFSDFCEYVKNM